MLFDKNVRGKGVKSACNGKKKSVKSSVKKFKVNASTGDIKYTKKPVTAAESYGWELDSADAWEAYEFACEYFGKENLDDQIVSGLSTDELAESLVYIFRMNDFNEWYEQNGGDDEEDEKDYDEYEFVLYDAEVGFDEFDDEVKYYRSHKDELSYDDLKTVYDDAVVYEDEQVADEVAGTIHERFADEEE